MKYVKQFTIIIVISLVGEVLNYLIPLPVPVSYTHLQERGAKYAIVEKNTIAGGVTKNTTAKITLQHGLIYNRLCQDFGQDKAAAYFKANELALAQYRKMAADINCDFEEKTNFIYTTEDKVKICLLYTSRCV